MRHPALQNTETMRADLNNSDFFPLTATEDAIRWAGRPTTAHECLPADAGIASTVRIRKDRFGEHYFAKIGEHVYTWSPILQSWTREL